MLTLTAGLKQVTAVLISFGAIIGKANPFQLLILVVVECIFYSFNKSILLGPHAIDSADGKHALFLCF
jgi:hypothetical protein